MFNQLFTAAPLKPLIYRYDVHHCPACGAGIKKSKHLCFYMVGPMSAVAYLLCKHCGKHSRNGGLPPDLLNAANQRLEAFAVRAGLVKAEGGHHGA